MGYYILACDENENEIAYLRVYPGGIVMSRELGYDWFKLIDANECDGGVSGLGIEKNIKLVKLQKAVEKLKKYDIKEKLTEFNPSSLQSLNELWSSQKREFLNFMSACINWCTSNKKSKILIGFY
ncbi:MAG: hypothetical protein ACTSP9_15130 [Promethearchaeota archaeon]